jgi:hypothetical protein
MKASIALAVAALLSVSNASHEKRHGHMNFHEKRVDTELETASANASCGCTTIWSTWYGEATCE